MSASQEWTTRYFQCAENPIKQWIAQYLDRPVSDVFDDYEDVSQSIIVRHKMKLYSLRLATSPLTPTPPSLFRIDHNLFHNSDDMKKSVSVLYDAVNAVWGGIALAHPGLIDNLYPYINEDHMCFHLVKFNAAEHKRNYVTKHIANTIQKLADYKQDEPQNTDAIRDCEEILQHLNVARDSVSDADVIAGQVDAPQLRGPPFLYIKAELTSADTAIHARLPKLICLDSDSDSE